MSVIVHNRFSARCWPAVVLITLAGIAVYLSSLSGAFIWDDAYFIKDNIFLRTPAYIPRILTSDVAAGAGETYNYYRPLTTVTYLFDFSVWKLNPTGYHISGILLHCLVAVAVYHMLRLLFGDPLIALIAGLLYVVHPLGTETVAYISGRPDSLAALCMLASFIGYVRYFHSRKISLCVLVILLYLLALLSRENSVVFPGLLLLYHFTFRKRVKFLPFVLLVVMAAGYVLLRAAFMGSADVPTTLMERLPGFFAALTGYLRLIFLPVDLHQEYGLIIFRFSEPRVLAGILIAVVLLAAAVRGGVRKTGSLLCFSVFWFFIGLGPVSGAYPIKAYIAEHWLYLPSIGAYALIAAGYASLLRSSRHRLPLVGLGILVVLFYGVMTVNQNGYFRDPLSFYERTLGYNPASARMHNNLGNVYFTRGRIEEDPEKYRKAIKKAVASYQKAIEIEPGYPNPYNNLGNIYYREGDFDRAIPLFRRAIELNPGYAAAYNNLGIIYCRIGRPDQGIVLLQKSISLNPRDADTYYNLGVAYDLSGRPEDAAGSYRESLRLIPDSARAHARLSETLQQLGRSGQAEYHLKRARELGYPKE